MSKQDDRAVVTTKATLHRSVTLVRGEVQEVMLRFMPTSAFFRLDVEQRQDVIAEIGALQDSDFSVHHDGKVSLHNNWLRQYVTVEWDDEGTWRYDDGEVTTLNAVFSRSLVDYERTGPVRTPVPSPKVAAVRGRRTKGAR